MAARERHLLGLILAMALAAGPMPTMRAADSAENTAEVSAVATQLAVEIAGIARVSSVPRAKREKQISEAVRSALSTAIGRKVDAAEVTAIARPIAAAAAAAAPDFAEAVASAIVFSPAVPRSGAFRDAIRAATYQAASAAPSSAMSIAAVGDPSLPPGRASVAVPDDLYGKNTAVTFTVATSMRHDNNVYLNHTGGVSDTIIAVTPGIDLRFGRQSLVNGSIGYKAAFTKYVNDSAARSTLGSSRADVAYEGGNVVVAASASFQQLEQNTGEATALNAKAIYRRDVSNVATNVQARVTDRVSVQSGVNLSQTKYKSEGLVGSRDLVVPVKLYVETTPKLNVSAGVTYGAIKPQYGGPTARDFYYNAGVSGGLSPKLSAQLSVGYRTREVQNSPRDGMWGFDGVLNYAATMKTRLGLVLSRNFSTGALGENAVSDSYALQVSSDPAPRWRFGGGLAYRDVDYGATVFNARAPSRPVARRDRYLEGNFQLSYLVTGALTVSFDATLRGNDSTLDGADFSNRIVGLAFAYRF